MWDRVLVDSARPRKATSAKRRRMTSVASLRGLPYGHERPLRYFDPGRHCLQFLYQIPEAFAQLDKHELPGQPKRDAGFAKGGFELTLLDCTGYVHKAAAYQWRRASCSRHRRRGQLGSIPGA